MNLDKRMPNINYVWAGLMVEELIRLGVDYFCIAPGSRSAPLAVSVAMNPKTKSFVHYDERGLAFHALGYVSSTHKPAVLIATSGTAAANFLPAVIESAKKKLPLIVLTADRPPELRKTGADQTIEQVGLFGEYVRWQFDVPCPEEEFPPAFILTTVDQAVFRAQGRPAGPVHLNCMFREPLAPVQTGENIFHYLKSIKRWQAGKSPYTKYIPSEQTLSLESLREICGVVNRSQPGIVVVGKLSSKADQDAVLSLADKLNWPVFPDVTSGLRVGKIHPTVISYYDQLLLTKRWPEKFKVDCVLHLGGRITSKRWYQWIAGQEPQHYIMVLNHPLRHDPLHNVTHRVESKISLFCETILPDIKARKDRNLLNKLTRASNEIDKELGRFIDGKDSLSEPCVARLVSEFIPQDSGLFLASSMPIREMDMFARANGPAVVIGSNRGASGIDGTIATAVGFATGLEKPVTLLIGDLAFLHDLNSLSMLNNLKKPVVIVVLNNDGGAIFSFLPIADYRNVFDYEKFVGTPHGLKFKAAAELFHLNYAAPADTKEFIQSYQTALKSKRSSVIEIQTDRPTNHALHQKWQQHIEPVISKTLKDHQ